MATESYSTQGNGRSPEEIEQDIAHTRQEMQRTVSAIEHKLSPGQLLDQAIHQVGSIPAEFGGNLVDSVKHNPLPVALVTIGLAWLIKSERSPGSTHRLPSGSGKVGETLGSARRRVTDAASALKPGEYAAAAGERLSDMAEGASHRARETSDWARRSLETALREQPLVLGALGIAIGAILGTTIPTTEVENEWMGPARDDLVEQAKQKGAETVRRSEQVLEAGRAAVAEESSRQSFRSGFGDSPRTEPGEAARQQSTRSEEGRDEEESLRGPRDPSRYKDL